MRLWLGSAFLVSSLPLWALAFTALSQPPYFGPTLLICLALTGLGGWLLYSVFPPENLEVYGNRLKNLRFQLRAYGVKCLGCERPIIVNLSAIEKAIQQRRAAEKGFGITGSFAAWQPSWKDGSVCKQCQGVICGECTTKAIDPEATKMFGGSIPTCPKCRHSVEGIDHLTD